MFLKINGFVSGLLVIFLMLTVFLIWGFTYNGLTMALMVFLFLAISFFDLKKGIIPNRFILYGVSIQLISIWIREKSIQKVGLAIGSGLIIALVVLIIVLIADRIINRPSMGGGDIKLILMLGMMTTVYKSFLALFLSCIISLIYFRGKENRETVPFGPSLCAGWFIVCCFSQLSFLSG